PSTPASASIPPNPSSGPTAKLARSWRAASRSGSSSAEESRRALARQDRSDSSLAAGDDPDSHSSMLQLVAYVLSPSFRATANDDPLAQEVLYRGVRPEARTAAAQADVTRAA